MLPTYQDGYIKWLRSHVGHELIYLVYTTSLVLDENDHLLVQERYDFDWLSVPGGALEMDESLATCAVREVFEETGIRCNIERFLGVFSHPAYHLDYPNGDQVQPWSAGFVCRASSSDIQVDGKEALHAAFRPIEEVYDRLPLQYQDMVKAAQLDTPRLEPVHYEPKLKPYYPILRAKLGHQRIILPGGTGIVFNAAGQVLVVHEKQQDRWGPPAGLADIGETSSGTIVREIREETGLEVEPVRVLGIYSEPALTYTELTNGDKAHWVDLIVECQIVGGAAEPDGTEIDGIRYMSLEDLLAQPGLSPLRQQVYADLMRREQGPFIR